MLIKNIKIDKKLKSSRVKQSLLGFILCIIFSIGFFMYNTKIQSLHIFTIIMAIFSLSIAVFLLFNATITYFDKGLFNESE